MGYTVKAPVTIRGTGIHSGKTAEIILNPKQAGGIVFNLSKVNVKIPLTLRYIKPQNLGTNLFKNNQWLKTIEHFLAVLWYFRITDLQVEIKGDEVPIADGSGLPIYEEIQKKGLKKTATTEKKLIIKKPVAVFYNDSYLIGYPGKGLNINYTVCFPNNPIQTQNYIFTGKNNFVAEVLAARTFGNIEDVEKLHQSGRALGASMENALVYNSKGYITPQRFAGEAVRHKVLDLLGDLYSSGYFVQGKMLAYKTSHVLNNKFIKKLLKAS
ncbi:MAG: UDP-3-O-acyl-N-acetylglucosamine deacetylase [Candidatus Margulisbacteria bacterium]|nr:UDP-3-O-acyl-N-acetylglucosamine deacetylase [Candidatus Margulisiibacteriota bacterium]